MHAYEIGSEDGYAEFELAVGTVGYPSTPTACHTTATPYHIATLYLYYLLTIIP
jgi:hypothetical protein